MDRVTFDFETGEVIFSTDAQQGTEICQDLPARKEAILAAAGYGPVDLGDAIRTAFKDAGFDAVRI